MPNKTGGIQFLPRRNSHSKRGVQQIPTDQKLNFLGGIISTAKEFNSCRTSR